MQERDPLVNKQSTTWSTHEETAFWHEELSPKLGSGLEHHFPIAYSQVGAGAVDVHFDAADAVVDVLKVLDENEVMVDVAEEDVDVL